MFHTLQSEVIKIEIFKKYMKIFRLANCASILNGWATMSVEKSDSHVLLMEYSARAKWSWSVWIIRLINFIEFRFGPVQYLLQLLLLQPQKWAFVGQMMGRISCKLQGRSTMACRMAERLSTLGDLMRRTTGWIWFDPKSDDLSSIIIFYYFWDALPINSL